MSQTQTEVYLQTATREWNYAKERSARGEPVTGEVERMMTALSQAHATPHALGIIGDEIEAVLIAGFLNVAKKWLLKSRQVDIPEIRKSRLEAAFRYLAQAKGLINAISRPDLEKKYRKINDDCRDEKEKIEAKCRKINSAA